MRWLAPLLVLPALYACAPEEEEGPTGPLSAALAEPSGACPAVGSGGRVGFKSNGLDREALIYLPAGGLDDNSGLLFNWYGTGGTASQTGAWMDAQGLADDTGSIVVIPEALPNNILEWEFRTDGENDLAFYDDLRTCLVREFDLNQDRVFTTGFSAGGLWSSFLLVHRADTLAAAVVFSGGADPIFEYDTPAARVPTVLIWGGPDDTWGIPGVFVVEFELTGETLRDDLVDDGHTVVTCVHDGGHTLPQSWRQILVDFTDAHDFGVASPFADGDTSALPELCTAAN